MRLTYELPAADPPRGRPHAVALIGIEVVRELGRWPVLRHVFDVHPDAGLHLELDPLGNTEAYAVAYGADGREALVAL